MATYVPNINLYKVTNSLKSFSLVLNAFDSNQFEIEFIKKIWKLVKIIIN